MKYPDIEFKKGKSDLYMMGHIVMPKLFFEHPEIANMWLGQNSELELQTMWHEYSQQWGIPVVKGACRVRHVDGRDGVKMLAIDFPRPARVPEPHAVVLIVYPERRFFVIEKASDDHIRRHQQDAWYTMSSHEGPSTPSDRLGYLCEWRADGSRRNHELVKLELRAIVREMEKKRKGEREKGRNRGLEEERESVWDVDLTEIPVPVDCVPLDATISADIARTVQVMCDVAPEAAVRTDTAIKLLDQIHMWTSEYGSEYSEITIHWVEVVRLLLLAQNVERALRTTADWVNFCHRERGSRSPELRIAYTWMAFAFAADTSRSQEARRIAASTRLAVRDHLIGSLRTDMPGANDKVLSYGVEDVLSLPIEDV